MALANASTMSNLHVAQESQIIRWSALQLVEHRQAWAAEHAFG